MAVRVSIIVPVFNRWACTRDCLRSLAQQISGNWFEVLVVDDGSTDQTIAELPALGAALFGEAFSLLVQPRNRGFAAAVNRAARAARGHWLFLLNNDTLWTGDCLTPCLAALEADPSLAGAGPTLVYPETGRLQHVGVAIAHSIKCVHPYHLYPAGHGIARRSRRLQCITAAAMAVSRQDFLELDGLFEGYVNGMEDVDFCARAAASGRHFTVLPQASLIHAEHQSPGRFARELENSRLLRERCGTLLRPDLHRLAAEDGYVLHFTPWLDPVLRLGPDRERAVVAAWKADPRPERLEAMLEMEPAWEKGYAMLAGWWEQRGDPAAALAVRTRQGAFLPSLDVLEAIRHLAKACGDAGRLHAARTRLAAVHQAMAETAGCRTLAETEHARAVTAGDTLLMEVWDRWMTQSTVR